MNSILQENNEHTEAQLYPYGRSSSRCSNSSMTYFPISYKLLQPAGTSKSEDESDQFYTSLRSESQCPCITPKTMVLNFLEKGAAYPNEMQQRNAKGSLEKFVGENSKTSVDLVMHCYDDWRFYSSLSDRILSQRGSPQHIPLHSVSQRDMKFSDTLSSLHTQPPLHECIFNGDKVSTAQSEWITNLPQKPVEMSSSFLEVNLCNDALYSSKLATPSFLEKKNECLRTEATDALPSVESKFVDRSTRIVDNMDLMDLDQNNILGTQEKDEDCLRDAQFLQVYFQEDPHGFAQEYSLNPFDISEYTCETSASSAAMEPASLTLNQESFSYNFHLRVAASLKLRVLDSHQHETFNSTVVSKQNDLQTSYPRLDRELKIISYPEHSMPISTLEGQSDCSSGRAVERPSSNATPTTLRRSPTTSVISEDIVKLVLDDELVQRIDHSVKYCDTVFEYRFVVLPLSHPFLYMASSFPFFYERILSEPEWRFLGIRQSRGWEHVGYSSHEPNILLFRRPLGTDPRTGQFICRNEDKLMKHEEMLMQFEKSADYMRSSTLTKPMTSPFNTEDPSAPYNTLNPFAFYSSRSHSAGSGSSFFFDLHAAELGRTRNCDPSTNQTSLRATFTQEIDNFFTALYAPSFVP